MGLINYDFTLGRLQMTSLPLDEGGQRFCADVRQLQNVVGIFKFNNINFRTTWFIDSYT